jgi:hypothetical protein
MSEPKLTPWFPENVDPVRVGVYERKTLLYTETNRWFNYWDGQWRPGGPTFDHAINGSKQPPLQVRLQWRGLARKPR